MNSREFFSDNPTNQPAQDTFSFFSRKGLKTANTNNGSNNRATSNKISGVGAGTRKRKKKLWVGLGHTRYIYEMLFCASVVIPFFFAFPLHRSCTHFHPHRHHRGEPTTITNTTP